MLEIAQELATQLAGGGGGRLGGFCVGSLVCSLRWIEGFVLESPWEVFFWLRFGLCPPRPLKPAILQHEAS